MSEKGFSAAASVFTRHNARVLLNGKYILMIGEFWSPKISFGPALTILSSDSVQRCAYKDLVALLQDGSLLTDEEKVKKMEASFRGDTRLAVTEAHNNTNFSEIREWRGPEDNEILTLKILCRDFFPDIICANSTFWDISRYNDGETDRNGLQCFPAFEENIQTFMKFLNDKAARALQTGQIPISCLRIWRNALPIGRNARGGLLIEEVKFGTDSEVYRQDMCQANLNIRDKIYKHKWDLLDGQYYFRKVQEFREKDGVHWDQISHRWLTNIFLGHICTAWQVQPPKVERRSQRDDGTPVTKTIDDIRRTFDQYNRHYRYSSR